MQDIFKVPKLNLFENAFEPIPIFVIRDLHEIAHCLTPEQFKFAKSLGNSENNKKTIIVPDKNGKIGGVILHEQTNKRFSIGAKISDLPDGNYKINSTLKRDELFEIVLGFGLSGYRYNRFKKVDLKRAKLCIPSGINVKEIFAFIEAEYFVRDLINTPASELGPSALEGEAKALAKKFNAYFICHKSDDNFERYFPLVHIVGRAGTQNPRVIEFRWGDRRNPRITLVGKGVSFDTGGLNIKTGSSMGIMKKDMGGAANVLGLAYIIMSLNLPVSLRVVIPAVENSISSQSFRPGDIYKSRNGLTVEINNTDAEGRLILADSISYVEEEASELIVCMATLTGAARVALGPDIVPFYTDNEKFSAILSESALPNLDPVWRMPFHKPYEDLIDSQVADLDNSPSGGMAGSILAALFLKRFVLKKDRFVHFDIYGWSPNDKAGGSKGGVMQSVRTTFSLIKSLVN